MTTGTLKSSTADLRKIARQHLLSRGYDAASTDRPIMRAGSGSWVTDTDGRRYLDFMGGSLSAGFGHNHRRIVEALERASETMLHCSASFYSEPEIKLAGEYAQRLPDGPNVSHFLMSGADANEGAVAITRTWSMAGGRWRGPHPQLPPVTRTRHAPLSHVAERRGYRLPGEGYHTIFTPYCYRCPLQKRY